MDIIVHEGHPILQYPLKDTTMQAPTPHDDRLDIKLPWGEVQSRTSDVLQLLPLLALIGVLAGLGYTLYQYIGAHIEAQRNDLHEFAEASSREHKAILDVNSEQLSEQRVTNYLLSMPQERRPKLRFPTGMELRIEKWPLPPDHQ